MAGEILKSKLRHSEAVSTSPLRAYHAHASHVSADLIGILLGELDDSNVPWIETSTPPGRAGKCNVGLVGTIVHFRKGPFPPSPRLGNTPVIQLTGLALLGAIV